MCYRSGQRVRLLRTNDEWTHLGPGDLGTVTGFQHEQRRVDIDWDSGSRLAMLLDAGDRIEVIADPNDVQTGHPGNSAR
jgi:hypothetical protein